MSDRPQNLRHVGGVPQAAPRARGQVVATAAAGSRVGGGRGRQLVTVLQAAGLSTGEAARVIAEARRTRDHEHETLTLAAARILAADAAAHASLAADLTDAAERLAVWPDDDATPATERTGAALRLREIRRTTPEPVERGTAARRFRRMWEAA